MKTWSISTTVRNPERIPDFTAAVEAIAGSEWNTETQVSFMYELIRRRLYKPTNMTDAQSELFEDVERDMTTAQAADIFATQLYEDPPMRGRTAIAPIRDMGLVQLKPHVRLTKLGQSLVDGEISLQDTLLNYNLKWEVPTPEHKKFKMADGYSIKPFIGTLALISRVNELWKEKVGSEVGLSREEFNLFAPTLIDSSYIDEFARRVVAGRLASREAVGAAAKLAAQNRALREHLNNLPHGDGGFSDIDVNNLRDYGDNAIRYFRNTGFIEFRGAGRYVDVASTARVQVKLLVDQELYKPIGYESLEQYLYTVGDVHSFTPPWATEEKKAAVKQYLKKLLEDEGEEIVSSISAPEVTANPIRGEDAEIIELKEALLLSRLTKLKKASRSPEFISEIISEYENLPKKNYDGYLPKPVALEYITFKSFLALNDALEVRPNYPVGDDGEPISTAPGGGTDLFCDYHGFVLSVEVSMSTGRNQWVMEGQPVQRHLREIEEKTAKPAFSLFLAPKLHDDTVNTFWVANVFGYQGKQQRIVPFDFEAWTKFLNHVRPRIESGALKNEEILKLLEAAIPTADETDSIAWLSRIHSSSFLSQVAAA